MVLPIVHYGDPLLRKRGRKVERFDAELARLSRDMIATMHDAQGIGLAAQQVGHALQFCVIDLRHAEVDFTWRLDGASPPLDLFMPLSLANPEVEPVAQPTDTAEEGCLSFPEIRGDVTRPEALTVRFQDLHGQPHELVCDGLLSRCVQHEVDHLNGVLFIDRMTKRVVAALDDEIRKLKKQTLKELNAKSA